MSAGNPAVQVNIKPTGDHLFNVYAYGGGPEGLDDELTAGLLALQTVAPIVAETAAVLAAGPITQGGVPPQQTAPAPAQQTAPAQTGPQRTCKHGAMEFKRGTNRQNGTPWAAWMCGDKNASDKCKPDFVNG